MNGTQDGRPPHNYERSLWIDTTATTDYPSLRGNLAVDVVVIGGGITGLTAAMILKHSGASVALIEARQIALGTTGNTTAKITALHGMAYGPLLQKHGQEAARTYAEANLVALEFIAKLIADRSIECDFRRLPAYTYTESARKVTDIEDEVKAARRAGLDAAYVAETPLPFPVRAAVRLDNQAQFHPRRYALALATLVADDGSHVFEQTRAVTLKEHERRVDVTTEHGSVNAGHAIIATLLPFHDPAGLFAKTHPSRSYAVSARVSAPAPQGMFICADSPTRSVRPYDGPDGAMLVVGGEEHKTGQESDTPARYAAVEAWARQHFAVQSIEHRWSAQDYVPADGIPYVGSIGGSNRVLVATGFKKWGMTNGTAAAIMMSDHILKRPNAWLPLFDPTRLKIGASAGAVIKENANVAQRFIGDRLPSRGAPRPDELVAGAGAVLDHAGHKVAVYHDPEQGLKAVSARCTHMGCIVAFNLAEKSWDCPCHGSRFDTDGRVIEGPATSPLSSRQLDDSEGREDPPAGPDKSIT
ncbi:MAG: FAD-dependent oxidoreductase [Candidatus Limnocylindria bacterium]